MKKEIIRLKSELAANGGIIPDSWIPWLEAIKLLLKAFELFLPDEWDEICEDVIAAINLFEAANNS